MNVLQCFALPDGVVDRGGMSFDLHRASHSQPIKRGLSLGLDHNPLGAFPHRSDGPALEFPRSIGFDAERSFREDVRSAIRSTVGAALVDLTVLGASITAVWASNAIDVALLSVSTPLIEQSLGIAAGVLGLAGLFGCAHTFVRAIRYWPSKMTWHLADASAQAAPAPLSATGGESPLINQTLDELRFASNFRSALRAAQTLYAASASLSPERRQEILIAIVIDPTVRNQPSLHGSWYRFSSSLAKTTVYRNAFWDLIDIARRNPNTQGPNVREPSVQVVDALCRAPFPPLSRHSSEARMVAETLYQAISSREVPAVILRSLARWCRTWVSRDDAIYENAMQLGERYLELEHARARTSEA